MSKENRASLKELAKPGEMSTSKRMTGQVWWYTPVIHLGGREKRIAHLRYIRVLG
jgi:hypothetical protein